MLARCPAQISTPRPARAVPPVCPSFLVEISDCTDEGRTGSVGAAGSTYFLLVQGLLLPLHVAAAIGFMQALALLGLPRLARLRIVGPRLGGGCSRLRRQHRHRRRLPC